MSRCVWKYQIGFGGGSISMPEGAVPLCVAEQSHGVFCVWMQCDPNKPLTSRTFVIQATGQFVSDELANRRTYVGTIHDHAGFVWHVYEERP